MNLTLVVTHKPCKYDAVREDFLYIRIRSYLNLRDSNATSFCKIKVFICNFVRLFHAK